MTLKIGVLAQYLNTRADITALLRSLAAQHKMILFLRKGEQFKFDDENSDIEVRYFDHSKYKYRNYFIERVFRLFGILPASKRNYFITEQFKLHNSKYNKLHYSIEWVLLHLSRITPKFLSYDKYLSLLKHEPTDQLKDIDIFFCITQIYDDLFYAKIQQSKKPVFNYVYSWDHPCKMKCFTHGKQNRYLVWSKALHADLVQLQPVRDTDVVEIGSTQLTYLHHYLNNSNSLSVSQEKYLYIAFATGNEKTAFQELRMVEEIILQVSEQIKDIHFIVRPYPFISDKSYYTRLQKLRNVTFDIGETNDISSNFSIEENYAEKYKKIQKSVAFLHFGTTLSLEASHLSIPVLIADMAGAGYKSLNRFTHQFQNEKYLLDNTSPNVIRSIDNLISALKNIINGDIKYLAYNKSLSAVAIPEPMEKISEKLTALFLTAGA